VAERVDIGNWVVGSGCRQLLLTACASRAMAEASLRCLIGAFIESLDRQAAPDHH
jgi:hypothetical protein